MAIVVVLVVALGIYLRVGTSFHQACGVGVDEGLYSKQVAFIAREGFTAYPCMVRDFIATAPSHGAKEVPPLRIVTVCGAALLHYGGDPLDALRAVSGMAAVLAFLVAGIAAWRLGGRGEGLPVLAFMAVAPLQVYLAHRGLTDGVFALFSTTALWCTWEELQRPRQPWPVLGLAASMTLMVLTKETALFVFVALALIAALARRLGIGLPSWRLWAGLGLGAVAGVLGLTTACGGPQALLDVIRLDLVRPMSSYSSLHQDGPWYAFLLGLLALSPLVSMFALAAALDLRRADAVPTLFVVATMATLLLLPQHRIMRVASMWDMPMAWLAWSQVKALSSRWQGRQQQAITVALVILLCASQFFQYLFFFQWHPVSDPATDFLLRCLKVVK